MTPDPLLTVVQAAARMGFPKKVVYRLIERGRLAHVRERDDVRTRTVRGRTQTYRAPGRVWIRQSDCDAWIAERTQPARPRSVVRATNPFLVAPVASPLLADMPPVHERRFS